MWRRICIEGGKTYVLNLCQDGRGRRFCAASVVGTVPVGMVYQSQPISGELMHDLRASGPAEITRGE